MRHLLADTNFRRLFTGRLVTNAGDSLYYVAAMWLVWELTHDPFYSGVAGFLTMGPTALQFLFGPLVDRWSLRRVLVGTQLFQAVFVLVVPLAASTGHLSVWVVLVVMPLLALANQLVYPAQSAALPRIVDQDDLVDANSAFSLAYQGVDLVFNAAAGAVVALAGAVALYAVDSLTFVVAALLFLGVHIPPASDATLDGDGAATERGDGSAADVVAADGGDSSSDDAVTTETADDPATDTDGYLADLRAGVTVVRGTFLVLVLAGAAVVNFAAGATMASLPAFADTVGGAGAYGTLMAGFAAGNLGGALVASRLDHLPFGKLYVAIFTVNGALVAAAAVAATAGAPLLVVVALFALGFVPVGVGNVLISAVVQAAVPESKLGRVSSLLGSASQFAIPFGTLAGGVVAGAFGPVAAIYVLAGSAFALAAYWLVVPTLRSLPPVGDIDTLDRTQA